MAKKQSSRVHVNKESDDLIFAVCERFFQRITSDNADEESSDEKKKRGRRARSVGAAAVAKEISKEFNRPDLTRERIYPLLWEAINRKYLTMNVPPEVKLRHRLIQEFNLRERLDQTNGEVFVANTIVGDIAERVNEAAADEVIKLIDRVQKEKKDKAKAEGQDPNKVRVHLGFGAGYAAEEVAKRLSTRAGSKTPKLTLHALTSGGHYIAGQQKVPTTYFSFFDGKIKAVVLEKVSSTAIKVKILNDGHLQSHKGINLPDTDLGGNIITEKDKADLEFGASRDFDYVAMSFIQKPEDIEKVRQILVSNGSRAKIIAKIETKKAIETDENLEAIVKAADGVMVARGDLAIEAGLEVVPIVQRKLLAYARQHAKLVIVATQMLGSMVDNPEPNRAEVNDVATAVIMGADVTMLSDESANGKYPIEAIKTMKKIILYTQDHAKMQPIENEPVGEFKNYDAIAVGAVKIAESIDADLIVAATHTGATANAIAAARPDMPIVSVTDDKRVAGQLALRYANSSYVREFDQNSAIDAVQDLKAGGYLKLPEGKDELTVVLVSGFKNEEGATDTIQIRKI